MEERILEKIRINELYDVYGVLLTDKQRAYVEYYYHDDYSLSEIAGLMEVSRNAVFDQIRIAADHMEEYESKLGLLKLKKNAAAVIGRVSELKIDDAELLRLLGEFEKTE